MGGVGRRARPPGRRALLLSALVAAGCGSPAPSTTPGPASSGTSREPSTDPSRATGDPPPGPEALPGAAADSGPALPAHPDGAAPPPSDVPAADREAGVLPGPLPASGPGTTQVVPGATPGTGVGRRFSLRVEVEDGLPADGAAFAAFVMATLTDPRGWSREGWDFVRTDGAADAVLTLASADTSARMCAPLVTHGTLSCRTGGDVVLTAVRWFEGAETYGPDRTGYRRYLVSHEVGHAIGKGHVGCPGPGMPAPTMVQQSIGVDACAAQPWPYP